MSADPDALPDARRMSGGHVVHNMIYSRDGGNNLEIMTGWADRALREYNQKIVRPARTDMPAQHPCFAANRALLQCSMACPREMRLGGRTATCNTERHALIRCIVKHKQWHSEPAPPRAWYQLWRA